MKPAIILKTLRLGLSAALYREKPVRGIAVTERRLGPMLFRTYAARPGGAPLILLHGLTRRGIQDERLVDSIYASISIEGVPKHARGNHMRVDGQAQPGGARMHCGGSDPAGHGRRRD
jgi:hypothetical protein